MSRPSLNSNLTALARAAGELRFDDSPAAFGQFQNRSLPEFRHKNCYAVPQGWAVKQYIGGSQRTLALFKPEFEYHATRFADLCIVHFWQYRKRSSTRIVTDTDLNYSVEIDDSARRGCPAAQPLLDQIERFLQQRFQINARTRPHPAYPVSLSELDEVVIQKWAIDDRLWVTQQTRVFNLRTLVREILGLHAVVPIVYRREVAYPAPATPATPVPETPSLTCAPDPNTVPVTTTGGDPGPVTISPLFSK